MKNRTYLVEGDHPIFRRVHDIFSSEQQALILIEELKTFNYENITLNGKGVVSNDRTKIV
jgi:hypothetical protein